MAGTQTAALLGMYIKFDGSSPDQSNEFLNTMVHHGLQQVIKIILDMLEQLLEFKHLR